MLLLVIDTSGKDGFVGLARAGEGTQPNAVDLIEEVPLAGGTFSAQLVPQISGLLNEHGFRKTDIDAFIVVSGPGSFTGLRVGLAAIKALAEILHKPIVAISLLEVIARSSIFVARQASDSSAVRYTVALDAGRGEAFVGQFNMSFTANTINSFVCEGESLLTVQSLAELVQSGAMPWIVTPDVVLGEALKQRLDTAQKRAILSHARPHSAEVAGVAWHKLRAGETVSPEQLEANYIRRSGAEIFAKPATSS
jgi:tRNA threonylcarbamoyladenosine biosynthesis protein TsaB